MYVRISLEELIIWKFYHNKNAKTLTLTVQLLKNSQAFCYRYAAREQNKTEQNEIEPSEHETV